MQKTGTNSIGIVGLGKMGAGIARRLIASGCSVYGYDIDRNVREQMSDECLIFDNINALTEILPKPAVVWIMVPSGKLTDTIIKQVINCLSIGDIVVNGGNSHYTDSQTHYQYAKERGIHLLDCGTSGGLRGRHYGYCLTLGGDKEAFDFCMPILKMLSPEDSNSPMYVGNSGAGHFVKMVHNGIEYGMMQALAEGFEIIKAKQEFNIDVSELAQVWSKGSIIQSLLLNLIADQLQQQGADLPNISAYVEDSGEGKWVVKESVNLCIPIPVITASLQARFRSRQNEPFGPKLLASMRNSFGGHVLKVKETL